MAAPILITGISGFLARHLAITLHSEGETVIGLGRTAPPPEAVSDCTFVAGDIRDFASVQQVLAQYQPRIVYHLAAQSVLTTGGDDGARGVLETNVAGTVNILEAARRAGTPTVIVASSDKQYGAVATPPYDDNDTTGFVNGGLYELSKAQQDQAARLYAGLYDTPAVRVARLVNLYGPADTNWTRIIPNSCRRLLTGERPRLTAGPAGAALREYLFVADAITALRALAADAERQGNAPHRSARGKLAAVGMNIASPHRHTAAEVIQTVGTVLSEQYGIAIPEPDIQPGPAGVFEPGHQYNRDERIRALLPNWSPRDLRTGLLATVPWYHAAVLGRP